MPLKEAPVPDSDLMAAVGAGSADAFETLYDRYVHQAHRVAFSVCHDDGQAEEAVQEAFLSMWQAGARFSAARGTVSAWLLTTVRYRAIDIARRNLRHANRRSGDEQLARRPASGQTCDGALRHDAIDRLRASLARLPVAQQEVITLAFYGQLSHTEIARRLDLPAGTIKGRMRLGLDKLRATVDR